MKKKIQEIEAAIGVAVTDCVAFRIAQPEWGIVVIPPERMEFAATYRCKGMIIPNGEWCAVLRLWKRGEKWDARRFEYRFNDRQAAVPSELAKDMMRYVDASIEKGMIGAFLDALHNRDGGFAPCENAYDIDG